MRKKLNSAEIKEALKSLEKWEIINEKLYRKINFENFVSAFSFMTHIAIYAEKVNHHPEWKNVYQVVEIWLTTHDKNGITKNDINFAKTIDQYAPIK